MLVVHPSYIILQPLQAEQTQKTGIDKLEKGYYTYWNLLLDMPEGMLLSSNRIVKILTLATRPLFVGKHVRYIVLQPGGESLMVNFLRPIGMSHIELSKHVAWL